MTGVDRSRASGTTKVVAVQFAPRKGDVERNLLRLDDLVRAAVRDHAPTVVVLPEMVTSPHSTNSRQSGSSARPIDGSPLQLFRHLSRHTGVVVAGGFHAHRGRHAYITYVVAEPDGQVHLRNKSVLGGWDSHLAKRGRVIERVSSSTLSGASVGVIAGWEWIRSDTARALRGNVEIALGGMCWPAIRPITLGRRAKQLDVHLRQAELLRAVPADMARVLGVPTVMASLTEANPVRSIASTPDYVGLISETQIVDATGTVLARMGPEDGEGYVSAEVKFGRPLPSAPVPSGSWICYLDERVEASNLLRRAAGALHYRARHVAGAHPWQEWPSADFANSLACGEPGEQQVATTGPAFSRPTA
jgi:predicted amidohydrolase